MGKCSGNTGYSPQSITVKLSEDSKIGITNKVQNIPPVKSAILDISKCVYKPTQTKKTSLPKDNILNIANFYNSSNFLVNNISVNNSCNIIPRGIIIAYYGKTIPDGWTLCDGTLCTPDLRGRSILGLDTINNKNKLGQYSGEEAHLLTIGELPSHNHKYPLSQGTTSFLTSVGGSDPDKFGGKSSNAVNHKTYFNKSSNLPHNNMPPFLVCSYIMKL